MLVTWKSSNQVRTYTNTGNLQDVVWKRGQLWLDAETLFQFSPNIFQSDEISFVLSVFKDTLTYLKAKHDVEKKNMTKISQFSLIFVWT